VCSHEAARRQLLSCSLLLCTTVFVCRGEGEQREGCRPLPIAVDGVRRRKGLPNELHDLGGRVTHVGMENLNGRAGGAEDILQGRRVGREAAVAGGRGCE
jgi:hypothetical protein